MVRALGGHLLSPEQDGEVPHSDSGEEGAAEATAWGHGVGAGEGAGTRVQRDNNASE